ncbi:CDP-6-deoxy-delta-3,4-glucoseen reductase [Xylophilus ampelinus]|uniref:CDP-4-dehydro-6-deoxyglucose reductase n=1 Tax=Xylophilus ampelinus TaxID=54067 RepID=A0A318SLZ9_9BURK|nr:CDP-6-deoxy-delta-3,4-glucoseen reductase [Xylophilus ampelinus]MCS4508962.1 CDP-6-deoxy-delta-3,4-glucoseen reductase [Xylophilus ampelinus]PYE79528.1 CDP-4-dehydro-6-deoxyglucose reductase [Xylophilus ampelinus]
MRFTISVQPSGRSFTTQPDEAILAAAIRQGIGLPYGCKDGACGSCKCRKLEGAVVHGEHQSKALSADEQARGFVLTCRAVPQSDVVLESRQVTDESAFPVRKMPVRVSSLERKSHDVMLLRLQLPATEHLRYHAGQYIEFILRDGSRRAYSMATAPHRQEESGPSAELHIRHMPGGKFTDHVFGAMKEKDILRCEGPFGSFFLREESKKPIVLLASGTGFAPVKALIERIQFRGLDRPVTLYWGGRRPGDLYLHDWVLQKAAELPQLTYVPVVSHGLPEDAWTGRTGFVHQAVLDDFADLSGHQVYACGAPIVVESAQKAYVQERGLPAEEFFADAFTSEADKHGA